MIEFKEFPKIPQYRNVQKDIQGLSELLQCGPVRFTGYVKLHGTNAAIGYDSETDAVYAQSRKRIITPEDDNMGFASWVEDRKELFKEYLIHVFGGDSGIIYGEWCGGNIQKGVAISELPKMFVIFSAYSGSWMRPESLDSCSVEGVQHIDIFPKYTITIDPEKPSHAVNKLVEIANSVEELCPVGEYFGVKGTGEGVVWVCDFDTKLRFKVKGEKHSVSKVKTLAQVDPEKLKSIEDFVEYAVTENRMEQGIQEVGLDIKTLGDFLSWLAKDIRSEELDVLEESNLEWKDVAKAVSKKAKNYYLRQGDYL